MLESVFTYKHKRSFSSLRGKALIFFDGDCVRFHRFSFSSVLTKVLYDAIDRFSRMEIAVGCEMVPVAGPARSALCGTWAREAGELPVGQSTLGWEGSHDEES